MSPRQPILRFCIVLLLAVALSSINPPPVFSADDVDDGVILVDSFQDIDDDISNGICSAGHPTNGPCTLRAAVHEANVDIANRNIVIKLPAGEYNLTIPPHIPTSYLSNTHSGDLNIVSFEDGNMNSITIEPLGSGPVVIRSLIEDRILTVDPKAKVIINNLTMRDGHVFYETNNYYGGGAIDNRGNLTLNGVSLLANTVNCVSGTSCAAPGGAIENWGNLSIRDSTLDGNTAIQGGAIYNGSSTSGNLIITYSTLSNNHNRRSGTITNFTNLTIYNSTFSGNTSVNSLSGIDNKGTLRMQSTTMVNIGDISAIFNEAGSSTLTLMDNIFKADFGYHNCTIEAGSLWIPGGYNIANDNTCMLWSPTDIYSEDLYLGSLGNWGGPTKTIMLNPGSPAIDHRAGYCWTLVNFIPDDQRHWPRNDGNCDTGAYEYSPFFLHLPFVTK